MVGSAACPRSSAKIALGCVLRKSPSSSFRFQLADDAPNRSSCFLRESRKCCEVPSMLWAANAQSRSFEEDCCLAESSPTLA
jgi:hypothetical protein